MKIKITDLNEEDKEINALEGKSTLSKDDLTRRRYMVKRGETLAVDPCYLNHYKEEYDPRNKEGENYFLELAREDHLGSDGTVVFSTTGRSKTGEVKLYMDENDSPVEVGCDTATIAIYRVLKDAILTTSEGFSGHAIFPRGQNTANIECWHVEGE